MTRAQHQQAGPARKSDLRIAPPADEFEREADRVAEAVVRDAPAGVRFTLAGVSLMRRCACGMSEAASECDECRRKRLQRKAQPGSAAAPGAETAVAPPIVHEVLRSPGHALDPEVRRSMEARFGADFGTVRLHTDARAAESAAAVGASAWTVHRHIAFAEGQFDPAATAGRRLLAHELAHVVQQADGLRRSPMPKDRFGRPLGFVPTPEQEEYDRVSHEIREWEKVLRRLERGELDDRDLANWRLRNRLTGLTTAEVTTLMTKVTEHGKKNPKLSVSRMLEFLEVRKEISTPMPEGATVSRDPITTSIESYSLMVGNIRVKVVTDTYGHSTNETGPTTSFGRSYSWHADGKGIVDRLTSRQGSADVPINPTAFEVIIQTQYQGSPNAPSAYGKGTTPDDVREKTTTLRVHEGQHGTDYIEYLRAHPFPVDLSKGVVGVLTAADMGRIGQYLKAFNTDAGKYTCEHTDQVGTTQDEFLKTRAGRASGIVSCRK